MTDSYHDMLINRRLIIRAALSMILLCTFCVLLILIFYVELPPSMETMSATLLGALVGNLTSTLSYWFDSTENDSTPAKTTTKERR